MIIIWKSELEPKQSEVLISGTWYMAPYAHNVRRVKSGTRVTFLRKTYWGMIGKWAAAKCHVIKALAG